ncbi:20352_t:CDS:2 [Entrophospora sp. SA101]|nr:6359_t:CDS:2 [Entrophospora sp. SA101]CAJ0765527.1 20352_t:CDS:2 [Entrophospora sp. SA101]CAJ0839491.1 505_t:CDS:2 [Entrophospora sp. SA101]CAJ0861473.1 11200_t:CDS:2 [Entrophospora sp. SA101]CAJ0911366.1 3459_t:CDS:2 [Entrophospora sp. SA101]
MLLSDRIVLKGRWSKEEDKMLIEYVKRNGPRNWKDAADYMKKRNPKQCRERWDGHLKFGSSREEELGVIRLREEGFRWRDITKKNGNGRTHNFIKTIYVQKLFKGPHRPFKIQKSIKPTIYKAKER